MRSQKARVLIQKDGRDLAFCHQKLKIAMNDYIAGKRMEGVVVSKTELRQDLADYLSLSPEAIKNYVQGYNGPIDVGAVEKMAEFLGLEWIELMREVSPMKDNTIMNIEKTLYANKEKQKKPSADLGYSVSEFEWITARNAVLEVYRAMRNFVSFFEKGYIVPIYEKDEGINTIIAVHKNCWDVLHDKMLDIPEPIYDELWCLLCELENWIFGLPGTEYDEVGLMVKEPDECQLTYFDRLRDVGNPDYDIVDDPFQWADHVTYLLTEDFYDGIGKILKNYRPREPYYSKEKEDD